MKTCTKCGESKPTNEFSKSASTRDGLRFRCKTCESIALTAWRSANREKHNATAAKLRAKNREKARASHAKWRAANPGKAHAATAKWKAANCENVKAYQAKWVSDNLDVCRVHNQNRRARKLESGGKLSPGLAAKLFKLQRGKCACGCKQPLGDDYHMDHIMPLALGGSNTDDNMQLLRAICNLQKHKKHPVDFMRQRGFLL